MKTCQIHHHAAKSPFLWENGEALLSNDPCSWKKAASYLGAEVCRPPPPGPNTRPRLQGVSVQHVDRWKPSDKTQMSSLWFACNLLPSVPAEASQRLTLLEPLASLGSETPRRVRAARMFSPRTSSDYPGSPAQCRVWRILRIRRHPSLGFCGALGELLQCWAPPLGQGPVFDAGRSGKTGQNSPQRNPDKPLVTRPGLVWELLRTPC